MQAASDNDGRMALMVDDLCAVDDAAEHAPIAAAAGKPQQIVGGGQSRPQRRSGAGVTLLQGPDGAASASGSSRAVSQDGYVHVAQLSVDTSDFTNGSLSKPAGELASFASQPSSTLFEAWGGGPSHPLMTGGAQPRVQTNPSSGPVSLSSTPPAAMPPPGYNVFATGGAMLTAAPVARLQMPRELLSGPPRDRMPDPPDAHVLVRLFIGNVRFEMSAEGLQFIFRNVCSVEVPTTHVMIRARQPATMPQSHSAGSLGSNFSASSNPPLAPPPLTGQPSGCAVAFVDAASADRLLEFNQRIFCTANGDVFFGTLLAMRQAANDILLSDVDARSRRRKGPKNCMVIEKSTASPGGALTSGMSGSHFPQQQSAQRTAPVPLVASLVPSVSPPAHVGSWHTSGATSHTPPTNGSFNGVPSYGNSLSVPSSHTMPVPAALRTGTTHHAADGTVAAVEAGTAAGGSLPPPASMPFYRFPLAPPTPLPSNQQPLLSTPADPLISGNSSSSTTGNTTPAHGLGQSPSASASPPPPPPLPSLQHPFELFVGGLPYEADESFVAWMLNACCPGVSLSPERVQLFQSKGGGHTGCAIAHIEAPQADVLLPLNKRIFCTSNGFYLAPTRDAMDAYVAMLDRAKGERRAGPSHAVVLEPKKSERRAPPPPPPHGGGPPPQRGFMGGFFNQLWPPQLPFFVQPFVPFASQSVVPPAPRLTPVTPPGPTMPSTSSTPSAHPAGSGPSGSGATPSAPKPSYRK